MDVRIIPSVLYVLCDNKVMNKVPASLSLDDGNAKKKNKNKWVIEWQRINPSGYLLLLWAFCFFEVFHYSECEK